MIEFCITQERKFVFTKCLENIMSLINSSWNPYLMFKIVSAFRILVADRCNDSSTKNIQVLISCGKTVLEIFEDKIKNEKFDLPQNIVLCKSAPQIEILKRYKEFYGSFFFI